MLDQLFRTQNPIERKTANDPASIAWLRWLAQDDANQQKDYETYRNYYNGIHDVPLTARQKQYLQRDGVDFRFNYLTLPVAVLVQRLAVEAFVTGDDEQDALLWQWWTENKMEAGQKNVSRQTAVDGDGYVLVEWDADNERPKISHELAYAGDEGLKVHYRDRGGAIQFASKRWTDTDAEGMPFRRLNIYTPDTVYKYQIGGGGYGWQPYEEDGSPWPLPWPSGRVTVTHFKHDADGSNWGRSELDDLLTPQMAINKAWLDYLESADKTAYDIVFLIGDEAKDKDGNSIKIEPGTIIGVPNSDASLVFKPGADLSQLKDAIKEGVMAISQLSQTPLSYFQVTGQVASSDTQRGNEAGLIAKAEGNSLSYGDSWSEVMAHCRAIYNESGKGRLEELPIETVWKPFERVDQAKADSQRADTELKKSQIYTNLINAGVNPLMAAKMAGYDDETAAELATTGFRRLPGDSL